MITYSPLGINFFANEGQRPRSGAGAGRNGVREYGSRDRSELVYCEGQCCGDFEGLHGGARVED
jgi:hypothetical protein